MHWFLWAKAESWKSAWEERATIFARSVYLGSFKQIFLIGYDLMRLASTCRLYTFCILFNIYFFFLEFFILFVVDEHTRSEVFGETHAHTHRRHLHTLGRAGAATEGIGVFIFFEFSLTFLVLAVFSSRTSQQVSFYAPR